MGAHVRIMNPGVNGVVIRADDQPSATGEYWHTIQTSNGERKDPGCNLQLVPKPIGGGNTQSSMTVRDLTARIERFRAGLKSHADLWGQSLDETIPEYPISNGPVLRTQYEDLARQLGTLRPYFRKLGLPEIMGNAFGQWDAFDSAVSNDVAVRKGSSMEAVLSQLHQALGKLDGMNPDSEFSLDTHTRPHQPQHVTNIYNLHGAQSRVNVQSTDHSVNVITIEQQQVFEHVRQAITQGVADDAEKNLILDKLDKFEKSLHSEHVVSRYQDFINAVASHMTIILPFLPALAQMLK